VGVLHAVDGRNGGVEATWPMIVRAIVVLGLAWATLYAFFPWKGR
jgi:hypothetical protein